MNHILLTRVRAALGLGFPGVEQDGATAAGKHSPTASEIAQQVTKPTQRNTEMSVSSLRSHFDSISTLQRSAELSASRRLPARTNVTPAVEHATFYRWFAAAMAVLGIMGMTAIVLALFLSL